MNTQSANIEVPPRVVQKWQEIVDLLAAVIKVPAALIMKAYLKRAHEALRESEEQFRGTFENAAVGIAHVDAQGRCLRANRKLCDIFGYSSAELLGRTVPEVTHPDDLAPNLALFDPLMRGVSMRTRCDLASASSRDSSGP